MRAEASPSEPGRVAPTSQPGTEGPRMRVVLHEKITRLHFVIRKKGTGSMFQQKTATRAACARERYRDTQAS